MKYKMTPNIVQQILKMHEDYWHDKRPDLFKYKMAYETKFWDKQSEKLWLLLKMAFSQMQAPAIKHQVGHHFPAKFSLLRI